MARRSTSKTGDYLDEIIAQGTAEDSEFPALVKAALDRRRVLRRLARRRRQLGLSQGDVAARMRTSQPAVARLEAAASDARASTMERFAAAVGETLTYGLARRSRRRTTHAARA